MQRKNKTWLKELQGQKEQNPYDRIDLVGEKKLLGIRKLISIKNPKKIKGKNYIKVEI